MRRIQLLCAVYCLLFETVEKESYLFLPETCPFSKLLNHIWIVVVAVQ